MHSPEILRQKLAELRANRSSHISTSPAPPPYTLSVSRPSGTCVMSLDHADQTDYYYPEELPPITIQIDNSITVTGDDNTVVLPVPGASSSTTLASENRNSSPVGTLTATIIGALSRVNALRDESGVLRPININVNSSVRVDGKNNIISRGVLPKTKSEDLDSKPGDNITLKRRANSVRTFCHKALSKKFYWFNCRNLSGVLRLLAAVCLRRS